MKPLDLEIAKGKVNGMSDGAIAKEFEVNARTIYRHRKRPEVIQLIEKVRQGVVERDLPVAYKNWGKYLRDGSKDKTSQRFKFEATEKTLQMADVLPSANPSTYIQQIFNQNNFVLSPLLQKVLEGHTKSLMFGGNGDQVVEAEEVEQEAKTWKPQPKSPGKDKSDEDEALDEGDEEEEE
jgi:hypothetical protein